jgi:hypothetical protein
MKFTAGLSASHDESFNSTPVSFTGQEEKRTAMPPCRGKTVLFPFSL